jgi:hypothetical protein
VVCPTRYVGLEKMAGRNAYSAVVE